MRGEESKQKLKWLGRAVFWLGGGLLVVGVMQSVSVTDTEPTRRIDQAAEGSALQTIRVKTVDLPPSNQNWGEVEHGDFELMAGETTSISVQDLPSGRPLILNLRLPSALPSADALRARIVSSAGSGELNLPDALVATDRDRVRVQIESGWLSPGRYEIEIESAEQPPVTMRNYLLEIL